MTAKLFYHVISYDYLSKLARRKERHEEMAKEAKKNGDIEKYNYYMGSVEELDKVILEIYNIHSEVPEEEVMLNED